MALPLTLGTLLERRDLQAALLPAAVLAVVLLMVVPVPATLLDIFFVFNILLSLLMLMLVLQARRPLDFSLFPTVLLFATLFRLALNVASTRVILVSGHEGADAAGRVIEAFGKALIGGDFAVGLIVFLILIIMNLAVIARGAGRVSEVAARFTLDALPGKQMAIDADLNAGMLTPDEARARRAEVAAEADFYGAMDGASKFVKGDAVAGLLILAINIIGGLVIGMMRHDLDAGGAADRYILLAVGDALVAQVPALLLSIAAAILVTRTTESKQLSSQIGAQFADPGAWWPVVAILGALALVPALPSQVLAPAAAIAGLVAWRLRPRPGETQTLPPAPAQPAAPSWTDAQDSALVSLDIGYALIPLVDAEVALTDRIAGLRRQASRELGFLVPPIRIRDDLALAPNAYRITIAGERSGEGEIWPSDLLALQTEEVTAALPGRPVRDPAFGLPAVWIDPAEEAAAIAAGHTVVDPVTVICTHLHRALKAKAPMLLSPDDVHALVELLGSRQPQLAAAIGAKALPLPALTSLLQALLEEGLTLREFQRIAGAVADALGHTQDPADLLELVRERLGPLIAAQLLPDGGRLKLIAMSPPLESLVVAAQRAAPRAPWPFEPALAQRLVERVREAAQPALSAGEAVALVTQPGPRRALWRLLRNQVGLPVVAFTELPDTLPIEVIAVIGEPESVEAG